MTDDPYADAVPFDPAKARGPQPVGLPDNSDEALAQAFGKRHANDLRYIAALGLWRVWDGVVWKRDETLEVIHLARLLCAERAEQCTNKRDAVKVAGAQAIAAVERLARADRRLAATVDQWDQDAMLLNTPDGGVCDLRTGVTRPAERGDYMTKMTAVAPGGDCPLWLDFLKRATDGDDDLQTYLQRMVGYVLTASTREHAIFFVHGPSATSKTKFVEVISGMLGDYAAVAPIEAFMASRSERHPTDLAGLVGARLVAATETEKDRRWAEARIKQLSGGDAITARLMRQDFFTYTPTFKLLFAGNHRPGIRDADAALRRRMHLIPFNVVIPESDRDPDIGAKLEVEWPGILRWAIDGGLSWQADGLAPPGKVVAAVDEYFVAEDILGRWIEERCKCDEDLTCTTAALFSDWKDWAVVAGEYPGSARRLSVSLQERGFHRWRQPGTGARGFRGVTLKPSAPQDEPL